jgi:DNA replication ATP-dependent helicase Dna2
LTRKDPALFADLIQRELQRSLSLPEEDQWLAGLKLLEVVLTEATAEEALHFSTPFARVAYVCQRFRLPAPLPYFLHRLRRGGDEAYSPAQWVGICRKALLHVLEALTGQPIAPALQALAEAPWPEREAEHPIQAFRPFIRLSVQRVDIAQKRFWAVSEEEPDSLLTVRYDLPDRNAPFTPVLDQLEKWFRLPVTLGLIDVEVDAKGILRPAAFVLEPDYLMDVSAIAECFKGAEVVLQSYLLHKFLPRLPTPPLLLGQVANFFLDELMGRPGASFRDTFPAVFQQQPLGFALLTDAELRELAQKAQRHWVNLKKVLGADFPQAGLEPAFCYLEPTFFSDRFGLQGRLDVLYKKGRKSAIVELKSGKPFLPNAYRISANHFTQTLLYYLLIQSAFGKAVDPTCYILYSVAGQSPLRYAPRVQAQQWEALRVRNELLILEKQMQRLGGERLLEKADWFFGQLRPERAPGVKGFTRDHLQQMQETYRQLDAVERKYLAAFTGFIAREHQLAKTGSPGRHGLASLWLDRADEKDEQFELLQGLKVVDNRSGVDQLRLVLARTAATNPLANFREGDLVVLYPQGAHPLAHQLFKGHIAAIDAGQVTVALRARQFRSRHFDEQPYWNLEHDQYEGNFTAQYRNLIQFCGQDPGLRRLLLGRRPPARPVPDNSQADWPEFTAQQRELLQTILASPDYYLLWGPPGTGKTSIVLRRLVGHLLAHSSERLLLLAYTNRAVDEMCAALESLGEPWGKRYLRIGSVHSTAPAYRDRLLDTQLKDIQTRRALVELIQGQRIIFSTVASLTNKPELFQLVQFDRLIVDEASQILEPALIGLLAQVHRFVLIGDHKQLPAVVVQPPAQSQLRDEELRGLGFTDARTSLFERLYRQCRQHGWHWAFGQLSHQGRMHREIMAFPNRHFYDQSLCILPDEMPFQARQVMPLQGQSEHELGRLLLQRRVLFLDTPSDGNLHQKTNAHEALLLARIAAFFAQHCPDKSLGVITPYRAQIAQLRQAFLEHALDPDAYTIDTVERYQGGARDIILISLCTNSLSQLASLVSLSEEGVNRKLNVALTRARNHLVVVGNPELLRTNPVYAAFLEEYGMPGWS